METALSSMDRDMWSVSTDDSTYIRQVLKLKEDRPDEVIIKALPQDNYGMLYAFLPRKYVNIHAPRRVSEETRLAAAERLRAMRNSKSNSGDSIEVDNLVG